jgi:VWFA-related protein
VSVNVVSLFANVHDKNGQIVNELAAKDFVLKEDGNLQTIRYFARETDLPLTIGLLIDTSRSQKGVLNKEREASTTFLNQVLREGTDRAFTVCFDTHVEILQGLTGSRSSLASSLEKLAIPQDIATLLYSAIQHSSDNVMAGQKGRKALILLTDGVAYKDSTSSDKAIEAAQRADTIIYTIRFSDRLALVGPIRTAALAAASEHGKLELKRMAKETGGISYEVSKSQAIETIFSEIEDALRSQYSVGYTPRREKPDGKYHKINLTTLAPHLVVYTREGYYAK